MAELTHFIDKRYTYQLSSEQIKTLVRHFNDVVTTKESINRERSSALLAWIGIALSLILSFVGVRDIVEFVNATHPAFALYDEYALLRASITFWLALIVLAVSAYIFFRGKKR